MAALVILLASAPALLQGTGYHSRKTGSDLLEGMIEQARTTAITTRSYVVLAVAEPGDLAAGDERCRLGLFRVETWPDSPADPVEGVLIGRWRTLETGIILLGGGAAGAENPLDAAELTVAYDGARMLTVKVHVLAFNSRGGLHYPAGSAPVAMRIAQGGYRAGKASANRRGESGVITESRLKIGRVTARPYRTD